MKILRLITIKKINLTTQIYLYAFVSDFFCFPFLLAQNQL